jgi:dihydroxyacetone kinase-like predicted kinase
MSGSDITPEILKTIEILEALETLTDNAPSCEVEAILQEAWIKVSETFPNDFKEATRVDAGAEGLRRYIRGLGHRAEVHPLAPSQRSSSHQQAMKRMVER